MSTIVLDGLDPRTNREQVENYCQSFGRILNCYIKSSQCTVTFANNEQADEFVRSSPHRLDSYSQVNARSKTSLQSTKTSSIDQCRLMIFGSKDQLNEKSLLDYFSRFGSVRMCQIFLQDEYAIITFDRKQTCDEILKQSRHILYGRSITVEIYSETKRKRPRTSSPVQQDQQQTQLHNYEKQQWQMQMSQIQFECQQQILHSQNLLRQMADEVVKKEQEIEKLKKENRDIDELLRQSVLDNQQQQIHLRKREDAHQQMKKKYEDLYKAYNRLRDQSSK